MQPGREVKEGDEREEEPAEQPGQVGEEAEAAAGRVPRLQRCPRQPTDKEQEAHNRTHWPPRWWCRFCTATRTVASPHPGAGNPDRSVPIISVDYCYPGASKEADEMLAAARKARVDNGLEVVDEEAPEGSSPTLIIHDAESSAIYACGVKQKGICVDAVTRFCETPRSSWVQTGGPEK